MVLNINILINMRRFILQYLLIIFLLSSCVGAGTHGSIKGYEYSVSKYRLEKIIDKIILKNNNVYRDTIRNYMVDITDGKSDTIYSNYYNDGKNYITVVISQEAGNYRYIFRYLGDSTYWDSSETSEIFIAYAYDENNRGGSEGNGGVTWYKPFLKKKLVTVFEKEFIEKINKELGVSPKVDD